jgi:hypothetical protein
LNQFKYVSLNNGGILNRLAIDRVSQGDCMKICINSGIQAT